ncbi:MAG: large conductance mechanosensitive channel protein MscL [Lachnospiraceae bacterium]|nr:large conductance mechanosensitive channel protein MscL [Lachnospiraceae bacterium]
MKKFMEEFKAFALRGNVVDLAVGVLIGGAFSGLVAAFTEDIIKPILDLFGGAGAGKELGWVIPVGSGILIGKFISAVINFLITAFIIFMIVKSLNKLSKIGQKPEAPKAPTTKVCPYCKSEIAIEATRCPHCTSQLEQ